MLLNCPGFGQDRVNFHQNPGRDTAGRADPTWPNRAGYSTPCAAMLGSGEAELGAGTLSRLGSAGAGPGESGYVLRALFCGFVFCFPLFCIVVVTVCCSVKLPLSQPTSFCLFLSILLRTPAAGRGGRMALLLPAAAKP